MTDSRPLLCRTGELFAHDIVRQGAEGLDVTSSRGFEVHQRRILYDDVELVTMHVDRGLWYLLATGIFGAALVALAIFIVAVNTDMWPFALPFFLMGSPAVVAFLIRLAVGREVVTVHGRRARASLPFSGLRKKRAREVYGRICAAIRRGQSATAPVVEPFIDRESPEPPPPGSVPLPPL